MGKESGGTRKRRLRYFRCPSNRRHGNRWTMIDIQIHRETGLVLIEKENEVIELVKEDVESLIDFYKENKDKIASKEEFE
jgi:hypothetical protein